MSLTDIIGRLLSEPHTSRWLRRTSGHQEGMAIFLGITGLIAFLVARVTPFPMLPLAVYGNFVVSIDADWWSSALMFGSGMWFFGIHLNGHAARWSSTIRMASTLLLFSVFGTFVGGSLPYAGPDFFVISCSVMAAYLLVFSVLGALDLVGAIRCARAGHAK